MDEHRRPRNRTGGRPAVRRRAPGRSVPGYMNGGAETGRIAAEHPGGGLRLSRQPGSCAGYSRCAGWAVGVRLRAPGLEAFGFIEGAGAAVVFFHAEPQTSIPAAADGRRASSGASAWPAPARRVSGATYMPQISAMCARFRPRPQNQPTVPISVPSCHAPITLPS